MGGVIGQVVLGEKLKGEDTLEIKISIEERIEILRFLCILNVGVLESIRKNSFTLEEAYSYFHRPYLAQLLSETNANERLIQLFEECNMLEDIKELAPLKLEKELNEKIESTIEILGLLPKADFPKYWLNDFDK